MYKEGLIRILYPYTGLYFDRFSTHIDSWLNSYFHWYQMLFLYKILFLSFEYFSGRFEMPLSKSNVLMLCSPILKTFALNFGI